MSSDRGRFTPTRSKEQGRKVTDLIKGFNAMNKVEKEQTVVKKRKASEVVEEIEVAAAAATVGKAGNKKKSRTSDKHGPSGSEKEISIRKYFKTKTKFNRGSPVGEHGGQEQVPEQGGVGGVGLAVGGNPVQTEKTIWQKIVNPDVAASQYCEAADDTQ